MTYDTLCHIIASNSIISVEGRFSHVEEKIKHFAERTSSLYLQFRREVSGN